MVNMQNPGFTLLELMISLGIVAVLAVITVPMYTSKVREGRRADATETLGAIALAEERYRSTNTTYGSIAQVWNNTTTSPGGYYTLAISNTSATGYTITATAVGNQANDSADGTACSSIVLTVTNGSIAKTPANCWPQ